MGISVGSNNANTTYFGSLQGAGSLIKVGSEALLLGGSNTYTGSTTISGGTHQRGHALALQNSTVSVRTTTPWLQFRPFRSHLGGLSGPGNVSLNNAILTVGGNNVNTAYSGGAQRRQRFDEDRRRSIDIDRSQSYAGPTPSVPDLAAFRSPILTTGIGIKFTANRNYNYDPALLLTRLRERQGARGRDEQLE